MIKLIHKAPFADNYRKGKIPRDVRAVTLHIAEGSEKAVDSWFAQDESDVSAHFLVGLDGEIRQYVSIHDIAYANGRILKPTWKGLLGTRNPNDYTVSIEHEGLGTTKWPEAQLYASSILSAWLSYRFDLPVDALHFVKHNEIFAGKTCPGPAFNREGYLERVQAVKSLFSKADLDKMLVGLK